jgi:hypothetical protein
MWGTGLYDDDAAADLRDAIALVTKVPAGGEKLLQILRDMHGAIDVGDVDGQTFWLVMADQFERRGIACAEVTDNAISIVVEGRNLEALKALGADQPTLRKRTKVLTELLGRLRAPRPPKVRNAPRKPPEMILAAGEVFAFPAMRGVASRPWRAPSDGPFIPDGWGALVVLSTGRAFDWLPWCAVASLTVDPTRVPSLDEAVQACLIYHLQTDGAARCVPRRSEIRKMDLKPLGKVSLDATRTEPTLSKWGVPAAIECGWSVAYAGYGRNFQGLPTGPRLSELITNAS